MTSGIRFQDGGACVRDGAGTARPVEVYCACPPELAVQRYNARATHPVHVVTTLELNDMDEYDRPVGIGSLVTVDTTVPIHVPAVATAVRARLDP